ncbi:MAG: M56 family metallopeptidase [Deltaproteobacteria bacterium]
MSLAGLAGSAEVHALGWALVHFVWQGGLIAAALWLVLIGLPVSQATARYASCCGALLSCLLAPPVTFWLLLASAPPPPQMLRAPASLGVPSADGYFLLLLLAAWALGSAAMTARLAFGVQRLRRLVQRAVPAPFAWQHALSELATRMGLRQHVRLLVSERVDSPLVLGWLRPVILVPLAALTSLPPTLVEALLAHELGHVRRFDYLFNVVQSCVEAALFYHPAVHWVSRCMRFEREHCCDDIAIQLSGDALRYARALVEMETLRWRVPGPALAAKGGSLMLRIERIVNRQTRTIAAPRAGLTASIVLAAALALSFGAVWACSASAEEAADPTLSSSSAAELAAPASALPSWLPSGLDRWKPTLTETAQRYGLDPALLAIVTLVESLGDPQARSSGGALGLMQLMPATAAKIAAERQLSDYSEQRLLDPAYNMDLGAWYLSRQLAAFGEGRPERAVELAAMAYNCGPGLLRAVLERGAPLPAETEQYRDVVLGMWNERQQSESPTYIAWRGRLKAAGEPRVQ